MLFCLLGCGVFCLRIMVMWFSFGGVTTWWVMTVGLFAVDVVV